MRQVANEPVRFGYASRTVRGPGYSFRIPLRVAGVCVTLTLISLLTCLIAMGFGDYPLSIGEVTAAIAGGGTEFDRMIVLEWRMPIALAAVLFGALLGLGGAIFQSLTRNPLGSPDIIGFDAGSYTAVVITVIVLGARSPWALAAAALAGGIAAALAIYLLAYRRGIASFRLIIIGIGVTALLGSLNVYLITRANIRDAMSVGFWGAGSISRVSWETLAPAIALALAVFLAAFMTQPALRGLELGDEAAIARGANVNRSRLALLTTGVATSAIVTATAGPIGFIALIAPQLARRLSGSAGVSLAASAAMGALLLTSAHLLSLIIATLFRPVPVGLLTVSLGGLYLIWLLMRETRRQHAMTNH